MSVQDESSPMDESALLIAIQSGDVNAFGTLIDLHLGHVRTFLALKAPVSHLVDEVAHETFVFAFRNLHQYTPGTSFRSWLRAIAWNLLRAEVQRYSRERTNQARYAEEQFWEAAGRRSEQQAAREVEFLEACVRQMPAPMQELLTLKYRNDLSTEEIANQLQRSLAWVRTVLFRLRQQLKECIEDKFRKERSC